MARASTINKENKEEESRREEDREEESTAESVRQNIVEAHLYSYKKKFPRT